MTALAGTGRLIRMTARRDRVQLPVWILGAAALTVAGVAAVADEFPTGADRAAALESVAASPAVLLMRGIPVGASEGAMVNFRNFASTLVLAALMSTFAVIRHTRRDEEAGRTELLVSGSAGRLAPLAAALAVTVGADLLLGAALTGSLLATGLPLAGSVAYGAACALTGMAFAGLAALAAQLFQSARAANAAAAGAVAVAYLVRGVGDALAERAGRGVAMVSAWPAWLSPLGWGVQVRPYGGERWWVLAPPLALLVTGAAGAAALAARRDLGAALVATRPGPARAPRTLRGPLGSAWRANRATTAGWVIGAAVFGVVVGSLGTTLGEGMAGSAGAAKLVDQLAGGGGGSLVDTYFAAMMNVFGVLAAGFAVQATLRARAEESAGGAEAVLAGAVGRVRWLAAYLACAAGGAVAILLAAGAGAGLADAAAGGRTGAWTLVEAGLAQLPAALVPAALVVLVFGLLPLVTVTLAWVAFAVSVACGLLGRLFGLPPAVRDLSPFTHAPAVPAEPVAALPVLALLAVAVALATAGTALFRRRDLAV